MRFLCPLLLLAICGAVTVASAATTKGAAAKSAAYPQPGTLSPQQQCIINKRKIMEAARRYYQTQYETKLLLIKLGVRRQQLRERRVRYQNFLRRMRLRHKRRIQQRVLNFKRLAKKTRKQYRKKLRTVTKKFQRRVMRQLKVKPVSSQRLRFIKKAFFKRGIISKRAAMIARKPIRPAGRAIPIHGRAICKCERLTRGLRRLNSNHVNRKTRQIMLQYQNKVQRRVIRRLRYLMQRTKNYVRAQIEDQVRKLRLDKCCRGPGKRHILKRRIQEVTRRLQTRAHIVRQRRKGTIVRNVVRHCRKSLRRKLRKVLRRVRRSRRRATRKLKIIQERILTGKTSRNWRLIQRLRQQRRRIIRRIQRRGKLIRRINRRRQRVTRRFIGRDDRRRRRVTRRREYRRTTRRRTQRRRRITGRSWRSPVTKRRRIIRKVLIKKVTKKVHIIVKNIRRALRKSLVRKRVIKRIRRRRVVLKRRIVRMTVKRRIIKRRIQQIRTRRTRLIRRMNLLRLRRAALVKKAPKVVPKRPRRVIIKQTVTVTKRIAQKTAHINKRLRILAVRVSQASRKIQKLRQRRINMKKRIATVQLRYKKLKFRILVAKRKARSEVKKLRYLINLKRKIERRVVRSRIVSRRVIRRIERKERRVISRTVRKFVHRRRKVVRRVRIRKLKRRIQKRTIIHRKQSVSAVVKGFHSLTKRIASAARRKLIGQSRILRIRRREIAVNNRIIKFRQNRVLVKRKIVKLKVRRISLYGQLRAIKKQKKVVGVDKKVRRIRKRIAICTHRIHKLRRRQRKLRRRVAKNVRRRKILRLRVIRIKQTIKRQDKRVSRLFKKILVRNIRWNVFGYKTMRRINKGSKTVTKKVIKQIGNKPARAKKLPVKRKVLIQKSRKQRVIAKKVVTKLNNVHKRVQRVIRRLLVTRRRIVRIKRRTRNLKVKIVRIKHRRQRVKRRIAKITVERARLIKFVRQIQSKYHAIPNRKLIKVPHKKPVLKKPVLKKPVLKKPVLKKPVLKRPVFKKTVAWKPYPKGRLLPYTRQVKRLLYRISICSIRIKTLTRKSVQLKTRLVRVTQKRQRLVKRIVSLRKVTKARKMRFKSLLQRVERQIIKFKVANVKSIRLAVKKAGKRLNRRVKVKKQILRRKISTRVPLAAQKKRVIRILRVLKKKVAKRVVRQVKRVTRRIARAKVRVIVSRRRVRRIVRRQIHLKRRIRKFTVRRRQLRRRIESVQIERVQLVRRVKKLKVLKVKVQRLLTARPKTRVILTQKLKRISIQIKRSNLKIAVLKRRVVTLKKRRVHLKVRIARCVKRENRLRRRIVHTRRQVRRQVKRLNKIVVKQRKFLRRMVNRRLISRQVVYRVEKQSRKVIKRYKARRLTKRITRLRRVPIITTRRVSIAGRNVVLPRLVTTVRRPKKGLKRKITVLKSITKKLRTQEVKILRKLSAPVLIRRVLLQRPPTRVPISLKKVTGGKKLLKVTKTEVVANKILHSKVPVSLNRLQVVQVNLRAQLLLLNKRLTSAAPSFKKLVEQTRTAYETDEEVVNTGFANSISEVTETYNQIINKKKLLYRTEYHTLVTEELRTADEEMDPLSNKWVVKSTSTDWGYFSIGCFKDQANRDLKFLAETSSAMTLNRCRDVCRDRGYSYFGVQNSNECRCGNSYGSHGAGKLCNKPCSGNKAQICGGFWHNNVYSTGVSGYKAVNLGCFHDKPTRDLPKLAFRSAKLKLHTCSHKCGGQGYKFFGLQNGNECWCGNSYGKYGKAPAEKCTAPCSGGSGNLCGGLWLNNVYKTGLAEGGSVTQEIADGFRNGNGVDQESVTETTSFGGSRRQRTRTQVIHGHGYGHGSKQQVRTAISTSQVKVFPAKGKRVKVVNPDGSVSWTETSESRVVTGDPTLLQSDLATSGGGLQSAAAGKTSKSSLVKKVNPDGSISWTESSESQEVGSPVETSSSSESGWISVPS